MRNLSHTSAQGSCYGSRQGLRPVQQRTPSMAHQLFYVQTVAVRGGEVVKRFARLLDAKTFARNQIRDGKAQFAQVYRVDFAGVRELVFARGLPPAS